MVCCARKTQKALVFIQVPVHTELALDVFNVCHAHFQSFALPLSHCY